MKKSVGFVSACVTAVALVLGLLHFSDGQESAEQAIGEVGYLTQIAKPSQVRIIWKNDDGQQLGTFPNAASYLQAKGEKIKMLMNGGIFEPGRIPSGLLIQDGRQLCPVNRKKGEGNFYLQPNGIFMVGPTGARIITTSEYPLEGFSATHAVQSGPLLLRKGKVHPAFRAESKSRLHRNGVGVTKDGEVVFVMSSPKSKEFPNLHEFAMVFRRLGCQDALFLDGDISDMVRGSEITEPSSSYGSIIAVVEEAGKK